MTKQTKDGWIRHRGGKCPVDAGAMVDVRYRDGVEHFKTSAIESPDCEEENWIHEANKSSVLASCDIMAYRVCEHVVDRAQVDPAALAEIASINVAHYSENPIQWRDRITQIDADIKFEEERHCSNMACMDQERAELVAKLAAEGFALIAAVVEPVEPVEDMSDWRNWKAGDLVDDQNDAGGYGKPPAVRTINRIDSCDSSCPVKAGGLWYTARECKSLSWHSRPTN